MTFPGSNVYVKEPVGGNLASIHEVCPFFSVSIWYCAVQARNQKFFRAGKFSWN